jgi:Uncharacterized protein family UPF0016
MGLSVCLSVCLSVHLMSVRPSIGRPFVRPSVSLRKPSATCLPGFLGDSPVREGFVSAFLLILFSELGDKTFFIAVLLALKNRQSRGAVFLGTFGALAVMTVISVWGL